MDVSPVAYRETNIKVITLLRCACVAGHEPHTSPLFPPSRPIRMWVMLIPVNARHGARFVIGPTLAWVERERESERERERDRHRAKKGFPKKGGRRTTSFLPSLTSSPEYSTPLATTTGSAYGSNSSPCTVRISPLSMYTFYPYTLPPSMYRPISSTHATPYTHIACRASPRGVQSVRRIMDGLVTKNLQKGQGGKKIGGELNVFFSHPVKNVSYLTYI